ncbi:uncharacterized protein MELLADRAFT_111623 [Melampsora larici-populina 98AG31]|uniref:Secreted protein n=1 Tax=Melampsora larici-populina (strain 98AG31 / pathotype 3-4-7) TaxID=747676 RepID=F4S3T3_MELLP|nr:uncharacterized protein MELLADRAFT_111623 [Melampsora larici-populina 98AG31]EGG00728.1 hypothetical protein MELLADRAFT_111623 [Melampsora larici-populina 98AG31]
MKIIITFLSMILYAVNPASGLWLPAIKPSHISRTDGITCPRVAEPISVAYPITYQQFLETERYTQQIHEQAHKDFGTESTKDILETNPEINKKNVGFLGKETQKWKPDLVVDILTVLGDNAIYNIWMIWVMRYLRRYV